MTVTRSQQICNQITHSIAISKVRFNAVKKEFTHLGLRQR